MATSSVSVLGFGNMGRALCRALVARDFSVTGWSRSDRSLPSKTMGVNFAAAAAGAIRASEVVICCLSNYAVTKEVLASEAVLSALSGKTVVQLSTGSADEAKDMNAWAVRHGIHYLEGKIAVVPQSIGQETAVVFYSGEKATFERLHPILQALGGQAIRIGDKPEDASYADFGFLCYFFHSTIGLLYAAAFYQAAGLDFTKLFELAPLFAKDITDRTSAFERAIKSGNFEVDVQSSLKVDMGGAMLMEAAARKLGLAMKPATYIRNCFEEAIAKGYAENDTSALVRIFRDQL